MNISLLHAASIVFEFGCFILALKMVFEKKRYIGIAWAVAFGLYVFFDAAVSLSWGLPRHFLDAIVFLASASALFAMWQLSGKRS